MDIDQDTWDQEEVHAETVVDTPVEEAHEETPVEAPQEPSVEAPQEAPVEPAPQEEEHDEAREILTKEFLALFAEVDEESSRFGPCYNSTDKTMLIRIGELEDQNRRLLAYSKNIYKLFKLYYNVMEG